jgi:hypothetical protein
MRLDERERRIEVLDQKVIKINNELDDWKSFTIEFLSYLSLYSLLALNISGFHRP